jgi:hypothetical protein
MPSGNSDTKGREQADKPCVNPPADGSGVMYCCEQKHKADRNHRDSLQYAKGTGIK